jgi:hypothetical protein
MKIDYSRRLSLLAGLILVFASNSVVKNIASEYRDFRAEKADAVTQNDHAFSMLKSLLPPQGTIGFISDQAPDEELFGIAQYSLSPVFVIRGGDPQLLVGYIHQPDKIRPFVMKNRLAIVHRANAHIFLFKKAERQ